jgi:hypothetical protein
MVRYYSVESPAVLLMDAGEGQLVDGIAQVDLHSTFSRVTDGRVVLRAVATPMGDCNGLYIEAASADRALFVVRECKSGQSNVKFNWIAWAVRIGYADAPNILDRPEDYIKVDNDVATKELTFVEDPVLIV